MPADVEVQIAVEAPEKRVRVVRIAGNLDQAAAARLLRLIDAQLKLLATGRCRVSDLLVDVENVRNFEPGGLEALRQARSGRGAGEVRNHLVGCSGRFHLLPLRARRLLAEFSTFPTVEVALAELARTTAEARTEDAAGRARAGSGAAPTPEHRQPDTGGHRQPHDGPGDLGPARRPSTPSADTVALPSPRPVPEHGSVEQLSQAGDPALPPR